MRAKIPTSSMLLSEPKVLKRMVAVLLLGVAAFQLHSTLSPPPVVDLIEYWSAARLLRQGGNPYSPEQMLAVERAAGWRQAVPLLMWNPPWTLPFALPMAWISYRATYLIWSVINVAIVIFCADKLWSEYDGSPKRRLLAWVTALTFIPAIAAIRLGQITPLILLGIIAFLMWRDTRPFLAGIATLCIGLKPQLLYLFWIALGLWLIRRRRWEVFAGALTAFAAAALVAIYFRPTIFADYIGQFRGAQVLANPSPNLGTLLRWSLSPTATWLQFVPSAVGAAWLFWHWMNRAEWEWSREVGLLSLVSLATTSYGWLFDQVTLLPAVIQTAAVMERRKSFAGDWTLALCYLLINAGVVLSIRLHAVGVAYTWVAPAWLALYLIAKGNADSNLAASDRSLPEATPRKPAKAAGSSNSL
jgi:hypothetical protein